MAATPYPAYLPLTKKPSNWHRLSPLIRTTIRLFFACQAESLKLKTM
jgi:hypothetical protein